MLFYTSGGLFQSDFVRLLYDFGIVDVILPFILIFTVVYAILQKAKIFGEGSKKFNLIIALVLGMLFVVPHVTGQYGRLGFDPVEVLNETLPGVSVLLIAFLLVLILVGLFGVSSSGGIATIAVIISLVAITTIFSNATGLWGSAGLPFYLAWLEDPDLQALLIIILVFGLIVWFITKEPSHETPVAGLKKLSDWLMGK